MAKNSTANAKATKYDRMDLETTDTYLKSLPKGLRSYLMYDSPVFWSPRSVYKFYRKMGAEGALAYLKRVNRVQTELAYGLSHPQA